MSSKNLKKGKTLMGLEVNDLTEGAGGLQITEEEIDAAFEFFDTDHSVSAQKRMRPHPKSTHSSRTRALRARSYALIFFWCVSRAQGKLNAAGLKDRLGAFYKNLPAKEIKLLLGDGNFTKDTLKHLLMNNDLGNFDPTEEAFKAYDPAGTGFVDTATMRSIFETLGYGEMSEDDIAVLVETADVDRDGKISLEDFRQMLAFGKAPPPEAAPPAVAAAAAAPTPAAEPADAAPS